MWWKKLKNQKIADNEEFTAFKERAAEQLHYLTALVASHEEKIEELEGVIKKHQEQRIAFMQKLVTPSEWVQIQNQYKAPDTQQQQVLKIMRQHQKLAATNEKLHNERVKDVKRLEKQHNADKHKMRVLQDKLRTTKSIVKTLSPSKK